MRLPVFQFTSALDLEEKVGAIFPSELEDDIKQSALFTVPVISSFAPYYGLLEYLTKNQFYFPGLINGSYVEIEGRFDIPFFVFKVPNYSNEIIFQIYSPQSIFLKNINKEDGYVRYIGKYGIFRNAFFLPVLPVNIPEMDRIYVENTVAFVGYTPNFGEINAEYFKG